MKDSNSPKHSPLEAAHIASGARMIEFGGWLMPLQYKGIIEEHRSQLEAQEHLNGLKPC